MPPPIIISSTLSIMFSTIGILEEILDQNPNNNEIKKPNLIKVYLKELSYNYC